MQLFFCLLDYQGAVPRWDEENCFYQEGNGSCFSEEGTVCKIIIDLLSSCCHTHPALSFGFDATHQTHICVRAAQIKLAAQ